MRESKVTVKIPRPLYRKIQEVVEGSGFNSPTDFVVYVLRDLMGEHEQATAAAGGEEQPWTQEELDEVGERVFSQRLVTDIYPESRALVEAHQRRGHTVAIVSSATHFQIDALARELGIEEASLSGAIRAVPVSSETSIPPGVMRPPSGATPRPTPTATWSCRRGAA